MQNDTTAPVLWVTLCIDAKNQQDFSSILNTNDFIIQSVDKNTILSFLKEKLPHIICLDYDFPDREGLLLLRQLRFNYPTMPVVMMTLQHCENLAVWAFRTGVREYLIKPVPINTLVEILNILAISVQPLTNNRRTPRRNLFTPPLLPKEFRHKNVFVQTERTALAVCYVESHFNENIAEKELATLCGMTVFAFSKVFRLEQGVTFREFLLRYRIERAKELLMNPSITTTDVAGLAGFSDASSFAKIFRRYVGQTPSNYRKINITK